LRYDATSEGFAELEAAVATVSGDAATVLEARKAAAVAASPRLSAQIDDVQTLEAALAARVNDPAYREMLTERDRLRALRTRLGADVDAANGDDQAVRAAKFAYLEAHEAFVVNRHVLEEYKDATAQVAARLVQATDGFDREHEGDTLGRCVKAASYDSGTKEWMEERQGGVGGSDVGPILMLDPKYGKKNYDECLASKTQPISEEELAAQAAANSEFKGATGRGNAHEPLIARRFAQEHPELTLIHSKDTWVNPVNPIQKINVDGILSSDGVNPDGILEIKTGSDASKWAEGVPVGYRAQTLYYLNATGFKYAYVAAEIDGIDFRVYRIDADEPITGVPGTPTMAESMPRINEFYEKAKALKGQPTAASVAAPKPQKSKFTYTAKNRDSVVEHLAAFRQEEPAVTRALIEAGMAEHPKQADKVIRGLYLSHDHTKRTKDTIGIDLETTELSDRQGRIIQIGVTRRNARNEVVAEYEALYSIPEPVLKATGTGAQDVHGITPDMIRGKPLFEDPEAQAKVREMLTGGVLHAHNAGYEKRWLTQHLDGYAEMKVPVVDTQYLSRYLVHDTPNNKLESFAERHGVPYVDAHQALPDARMTMDAVFGFMEEAIGKRELVDA
jgi:DNA polymerase III epsilon subunit-like protein/predicted phage-related endonuclease